MSAEVRHPGSLVAAQTAAPRAHTSPEGDQAAYLSDLDTQLMLQYRAGQMDAANVLIRRNLDRVTRFVTRVVRDSRVVEDLVQDVFLHVLTRAETYVPAARFSTWLYRVATNTALDYLRQTTAKKRKDATQLLDAELPLASNLPPDHAMNLDELRQRLAALIDELPPNQRIALVLFETEDLTYHQVAQILSVSVESVRALLLRARATLRRRLAPMM